MTACVAALKNLKNHIVCFQSITFNTKYVWDACSLSNRKSKMYSAATTININQNKQKY